MTTTKLTRFVLSKWNRVTFAITLGIALLLITVVLFAQAGPSELKVMKTGLGLGRITSTSTSGIDCGIDCDEGYATSVTVTLHAEPDATDPMSVSTFVGWSGFCTGTADCPVPMTEARVVRAEFGPPATIPTITDLTPEGTDGTGGIRGFLNANTKIDSAARFIAALDPVFRQNWILMSRSESLQTGIARSPRILMPSADAKAVFTIGMTEHSAYPGAHHDAIEYMQWDPAQKNFRFHEIVVKAIPAMDVITLADPVSTRATYPARPRGISVDDAKCPKCHSTRNIPSLDRMRIPAVPGPDIGTDGRPPGSVKAKNKPNWDAYDSWGGMLPFNRDRIYQGTLEAASFRHIFNLWNWRGSDENDRIRQILEQLSLQPFVLASPHNITRVMDSTADDQHIVFGFDALGSPISTTSSLINYSFDRTPEAATTVPQGGRYVTLRTLTPIPDPGTDNDTYMNPGSDEGRAVQFFDLLGGLDGSLNAQRISDEIINHSYATGSVPIDVRPLALAISNQCLQIDNTTSPVTIRARSGATTPPPSAAVLAFFDARNGGMNIDQVRSDTMRRWVAATGVSPEVLATRSTNLPRRKVDIQKFNFDRTNDPYLVTGSPENGLIQQYGGSTNTNTSVTRLREEIFRRPTDLPSPDNTVIGGKYVDREAYDYNTDRVALFRYFLEPLGVSVDKWSMGVRGRSRTYTFADVFSTYTTPIFEPDLIASLGTRRPPGFEDPTIPFDPENCSNLLTAVNNSISSLPTTPGADAVPKYTDVQRIFNKSCIECHGGLLYPPYRNYAPLQYPLAQLDLSENENPVFPIDRLTRSHDLVAAPPYISMPPDPRTSRIYRRICPGAAGVPDINSPCPVQADAPFDERCPDGLMPCGGPRLSHTDIATIRRWIAGGATNSRGDTHIKTLDGVWYDFQSAGEFTLLRDQDLEIQTRQVPVQTDRPLDPNEHTGLVSCASLNSAVAVRAGGHRITYQPDLSGRPNPEGLQLRIDGQLAQMTPQGIILESGGRIIQTPAAGGIQIETPSGTVVVITPGFWTPYQVWYLDVETHYARATEGVMGPLAPGSWLPALPDGSSMGSLPLEMSQRYVDLYDKFENAWRVKDANSLFDYAPGTSTASFTIDSWPTENPKACLVPTRPEEQTLKAPAKALSLEVAKQHCGPLAAEDAKANCTQDVMVTGDPTFAQTYLRAELVARNKLPAAPELVSPADANRELAAPVSFTWNTTSDVDGDALTYRHCLWSVGSTYNFNKCELIPIASSRWSGIWPYLLLALLIICLLLALLIFMRNRRPALLGFAVIVILAAVVLAVYIGKTRTTSGTLAKTVSGLESGKAYYWKVITEDGKGGTVESETRRFQIK